MDAMSQRTTTERYQGLLRDPSGSLPDFGAIFMASRITKEECFRTKLFGLPNTFASFVDKVKAGMVLFLFEPEKRLLHGVFEAISDGATDIVPGAYSSSGKRFSAQVRVQPIWRCYPLSEREFRYAIQENYYAAKKFNFGLSKDQVQRLLLLFESNKVRTRKSLNPVATQDSKRHSKFLDDGRIADCDTIEVRSSSISVLDSEKIVLDVSSSSFEDDLGDYIPLASPDDCDHVGGEFMPENPADDDSIFPSIVESSKSEFTKTEVNPSTQGLYSDTSAKKRESVFSRLNLDSKLRNIKEKDDSAEVELSVDDIMDRLQKSLENNHTKKKKKKKKGNVFSRLRYTPKPVHDHDPSAALADPRRKRPYGEWHSCVEQSMNARSVKPRFAENIPRFAENLTLWARLPVQISYQERSAIHGSIRFY